MERGHPARSDRASSPDHRERPPGATPVGCGRGRPRSVFAWRSRALLDKTGDERNALSSVSPLGISDDLDFADTFTTLLNSGTVTEEKRVVLNGAPARLLVLQLKEPKREREITIGKVSFTENRLSVWIGADNVPLAAEHSRKTSAGFLMFHGDATSKRAWQFARRDDHFIVARREDWSSFSGLGQQGQTHAVVMVSIH